MMSECKPEAAEDQPERKAVPMEASVPGQEDYPFHIVPSPLVPWQTGWSIVPW